MQNGQAVMPGRFEFEPVVLLLLLMAALEIDSLSGQVSL
jgi:hypothetical protein